MIVAVVVIVVLALLFRVARKLRRDRGVQLPLLHVRDSDTSFARPARRRLDGHRWDGRP